jgi:hypothetical protein
MNVTNKELAIALAVAELKNVHLVSFLPVGRSYRMVLEMFKRKKFVEFFCGNWILTDKGRRKFLNGVVGVDKNMNTKFKAVEEFVNNL